MKNTIYNTSLFTFLLVLIFALIACGGDGTTDSKVDDMEESNPTNSYADNYGSIQADGEDDTVEPNPTYTASGRNTYDNTYDSYEIQENDIEYVPDRYSYIYINDKEYNMRNSGATTADSDRKKTSKTDADGKQDVAMNTTAKKTIERETMKESEKMKDKKAMSASSENVATMSSVSVPPTFGKKCMENKNPEDCTNKAIQSYVTENINYPDVAVRRGQESVEYVTFVIGRDGEVKKNKISVRSADTPCQGCKEEAKRIVMNMPDWTPGKQNGRDVAVQVTLPIRFEVVE